MKSRNTPHKCVLGVPFFGTRPGEGHEGKDPARWRKLRRSPKNPKKVPSSGTRHKKRPYQEFLLEERRTLGGWKLRLDASASPAERAIKHHQFAHLA